MEMVQADNRAARPRFASKPAGPVIRGPRGLGNLFAAAPQGAQAPPASTAVDQKSGTDRLHGLIAQARQALDLAEHAEHVEYAR
jgi:hypothetical protein